MDRSLPRLLEDNAFLEEILLDENALDSDLGNETLELEEPHAAKRWVVSYIVTALRFFYEQNQDQILAPYNFEYVKTTLAVYTGCKLNTHDLI